MDGPKNNFRLHKWGKQDWRVMQYKGRTDMGLHTWTTYSTHLTKRAALAALDSLN